MATQEHDTAPHTSDAVPSRAPGTAVETGAPTDSNLILETRDLKKHFPITRGMLRRNVGAVRAVDGVDITIRKGEIHGLVGESGSGKTTTGRMIMRAIDPTSGQIWFQDKDIGWVDVAAADKTRLRQARRNLKMVYQDPYSSLNPRMTVQQVVAEHLKVNHVESGKALNDRVSELLELVGLRPEYAQRYPHAFSGGQRQRIAIARALSMQPQLLICDEPVSALDVSVQAQILRLLRDLQNRFGLSYLFVAHDLSVVENVSDHVSVMYVGQIVESAPTYELYRHPLHPYTEALMSAVPRPDPKAAKKRIVLQGELPSPANPPSGCYFHPRCRYAQERCRTEAPALREIQPGHVARCHFAGELNLQGFIETNDGPAIPNQITRPAPTAQPTPGSTPLQAD